MSIDKSQEIPRLPVLIGVLKGLSRACLSISFYTAKLQASICAHRCFQKSNTRTIDEQMWTLQIPVWGLCIRMCEAPESYILDNSWLYVSSQDIIAWPRYDGKNNPMIPGHCMSMNTLVDGKVVEQVKAHRAAFTYNKWACASPQRSCSWQCSCACWKN